MKLQELVTEGADLVEDKRELLHRGDDDLLASYRPLKSYIE